MALFNCPYCKGTGSIDGRQCGACVGRGGLTGPRLSGLKQLKDWLFGKPKGLCSKCGAVSVSAATFCRTCGSPI